MSSGQTSGGELWIYMCTEGPEEEFHAQILDCNCKIVRFDGHNPHMTLSYEGTRVSVVAYIHQGASSISSADQAVLTSWGFALPESELMDQLESKVRS